jgi:enoyl-CoA hydratase
MASSDSNAQFETLLYRATGPVATITLNRPDQLNTIVPPMPDEIEAAIGLAERDRTIKVIVLHGAGRAFSGGYDFGGGFQQWGEGMMTDGQWDPGKDFAMVTARETGPTQKFMAIWRASKPVIAQVHGWCVGGASDYALCADIVIASDDAVIGTPYSRMWGTYLTGMWLYRLSLAKVKWHSLTGRPLTGVQAAEVELINEAVPFERLEARVAQIAAELAPDPDVSVACAETDRQPGVREHGPGVDADAGRDPRRPDAKYAGRTRLHPDRRDSGCAHRSRAPRRAVRGLQPGATRAAAGSHTQHRA